MKVSRAASTDRIEKGRRSGGSAETPALIITNWPGRASRAVSGCRKVSRKYAPPRASRSTSGATRLAGIGAMIPGTRRARRPRRPRIGYALSPCRGRRWAARPSRPRSGRSPSARSTLYLNPGLSLRREARALLLCLFLPWAAGGTLALALVAGAATAVRWWPRPFRPVIAGRPFFASLAFLALAVAAALYWHNLLAYRHALPLDTLRALAVSAVVVTGAAAVFLAIGLDLALFPRHDRPLAAALAVLAPAAALAVPLALRPELPPPAPPVPVQLDAGRPARRVVVVGIDGLSPADVTRRRRRRRSRLRPPRAAGRLRSARDAAAHRGPPDLDDPHDRAPPARPRHPERVQLPASRLGQRVGPAAQGGPGGSARAACRSPRAGPSPPPRGGGGPCGTSSTRSASRPASCGSGARTRRRRSAASSSPPTSTCCAATPSARRAPSSRGTCSPRSRARAVGPRDLDPALLADLADAAAPAAKPLDDPLLRALARDALAPDLTYARAAEVLRKAYAPSLLVALVPRLRRGRARVLPLRAPRGLRRRGRRRTRAATAACWAATPRSWSDGWGRSSGTSARGRARRPLRPRAGADAALAPARRHPDRHPRSGAASHGGAPDGVLLVVGEGIRPGAVPANASVLDVAPTILYLMGLPVARDMEGRVLTEILEPEFAQDNPVTFIPSYESLAVAPAAPGAPLDDLPPLPEEPR